MSEQTEAEEVAAATAELSTTVCWHAHREIGTERIYAMGARQFAKWLASDRAKILNLEGCRLASLPPALSKLAPQVRAIDVSHNYLRSLASTFLARCTTLQTLCCAFNKLVSLPSEVGMCTELRVLACSFNQLSSLPAELGACVALRELYCNHNQLSVLPTEFGAFTALQFLNCSKNKLTSLPAELGACTALQMLCCYGNQLESLPVELGACEELQDLDCSDNKLKTLPAHLGRLPKLRRLECDDNWFVEGAPTTIEALRDAAQGIGRRTKRARVEETPAAAEESGSRPAKRARDEE